MGINIRIGNAPRRRRRRKAGVFTIIGAAIVAIAAALAKMNADKKQAKLPQPALPAEAPSLPDPR
jgi:hypothetical protein